MLAINVGTTYGALGSDASALVAVLDAMGCKKVDKKEGHEEDKLSENVDVRGTDPVKRTVMTPSASNAMPSDLEKYTSKAILCERRFHMNSGSTHM